MAEDHRGAPGADGGADAAGAGGEAVGGGPHARREQFGRVDRLEALAGEGREAETPPTLLYRLTKIEELSGREVREPRTAMAMYLACLADAL
ncbi:helix-turn-helix domain-containing protein [Streptomyces sp. NPDC054940]